jgi:hypothetical protein
MLFFNYHDVFFIILFIISFYLFVIKLITANFILFVLIFCILFNYILFICIFFSFFIFLALDYLSLLFYFHVVFSIMRPTHSGFIWLIYFFHIIIKFYYILYSHFRSASLIHYIIYWPINTLFWINFFIFKFNYNFLTFPQLLHIFVSIFAKQYSFYFHICYDLYR